MDTEKNGTKTERKKQNMAPNVSAGPEEHNNYTSIVTFWHLNSGIAQRSDFSGWRILHTLRNHFGEILDF